MSNLTPKEKRYLLGETTFISFSVVVLIVMVTLFVASIDGRSTANASIVQQNKLEIQETRKMLMDAAKQTKDILYKINERLSRIEGKLEHINRPRP